MRPLPVRVRPAAERDLDDAFRYLAREAGVAAALRFDSGVQAAFERLAEMPGIGAPHQSPLAELVGVRRWSLPDFRNYLVFYRESESGIEVLRVLHAARDLDSLLLEDELEEPFS